MSTPSERHLANMKPSIDMKESIGPLDLTIKLKIKRTGYDFNTVQTIKAIEDFRAAIIASVQKDGAS